MLCFFQRSDSHFFMLLFLGSEPPVFRCDKKMFQVSGVRAIVGKDVDVATATESAMITLKGK